MSDAPERIWAGCGFHGFEDDALIGGWASVPSENRVYEYVRADRFDELEAKLAKAVDVLGYYARNDDGGSIARTALEQLTGGKKDE